MFLNILHMLSRSHHRNWLKLNEMIRRLMGGKQRKSFSAAGFEVRSQFSAKALLEGIIDIWVPPSHWRIHFPVLRKGALWRGNISRWTLPLLAKLFWDFSKKVKMKGLRQWRKNENRLLHCGFSTLGGDFSHQMRDRNCKHGKYADWLQIVFREELRAD